MKEYIKPTFYLLDVCTVGSILETTTFSVQEKVDTEGDVITFDSSPFRQGIWDDDDNSSSPF